MVLGYNALTDSDGVTHYVYPQQQNMSCALACMFMIENISEQMTHAGGEDRVSAESYMFPGSLLASQLAGENHGQGSGTGEENARQLFGALGLTLTVKDTFDPTTGTYGFFWRKDKIKAQKPGMIMVGWYRRQNGVLTRNGGHFIVAARVTSRNHVVVLDPWRGTLHELRGSAGRYLNHGLNGLMDAIYYTG